MAHWPSPENSPQQPKAQFCAVGGAGQTRRVCIALPEDGVGGSPADERVFVSPIAEREGVAVDADVVEEDAGSPTVDGAGIIERVYRFALDEGVGTGGAAAEREIVPAEFGPAGFEEG